MNKITEDLNYTGSHPQDVKRIKTVCFKNGYCVSLNDCETLWLKYSSYQFATWIQLPKTDPELWKIIIETLT